MSQQLTMNFDQPRQNSISVWRTKICPFLTASETVVLNAMRAIGKPCTMHEVADYMNVPLNKISGRFGHNGLRGKGKITVVGKTEDNKSLFKIK